MLAPCPDPAAILGSVRSRSRWPASVGPRPRPTCTEMDKSLRIFTFARSMIAYAAYVQAMPWTSPPDDPVPHPGDGRRVRTLGPVVTTAGPFFRARSQGRSRVPPAAIRQAGARRRPQRTAARRRRRRSGQSSGVRHRLAPRRLAARPGEDKADGHCLSADRPKIRLRQWNEPSGPLRAGSPLLSGDFRRVTPPPQPSTAAPG